MRGGLLCPGQYYTSGPLLHCPRLCGPLWAGYGRRRTPLTRHPAHARARLPFAHTRASSLCCRRHVSHACLRVAARVRVKMRVGAAGWRGGRLHGWVVYSIVVQYTCRSLYTCARALARCECADVQQYCTVSASCAPVRIGQTASDKRKAPYKAFAGAQRAATCCVGQSVGMRQVQSTITTKRWRCTTTTNAL